MSALKKRQLIRSLPWGVKQPYPVDGRFEVLFVDCELVVAGRDEGGFVTHVGDVGSCKGGGEGQSNELYRVALRAMIASIIGSARFVEAGEKRGEANGQPNLRNPG
jgi:hypothetical protein